MKICRVCYSPNCFKLQSLFSKNHPDLLYKLTRLQVHVNDGLSQLICDNCSQKLQEFDKFRRKCIFADKLLRNPLEFRFDNSPDNIIILDSNGRTNKSISQKIIIDGQNCIGKRDNSDKQKSSRQLQEKQQLEWHARKDELQEPTMEALANQTIVVHDPTMKFVCHCGKKFMYKSGLATHKKTHRKVSRGFICRICSKIFSHKSQLMKHRSLHVDEWPLDCDQCGTRFQVDFDLQNHKNNHNRIREYPCDFCRLTMTTRAELRSHLHIHSELTQFICPICEKKFRSKGQVGQHLLTHTGSSKPFQCNNCSKCYASRNSLDIHRMKHLLN